MRQFANRSPGHGRDPAFDLQPAGVRIGDAAQEERDGLAANGVGIHPHGGKAGRHDGGRRQVVETDDRDVARHPQAGVLERVDEADGRVVVHRENPGPAGFSGRAVQILKACGVNDLKTVNVLEDDEIRQGIKDYANWPTIPQLYVNGEFVGGSDIMMEMYQAGELQTLLHA